MKNKKKIYNTDNDDKFTNLSSTTLQKIHEKSLLFASTKINCKNPDDMIIQKMNSRDDVNHIEANRPIDDDDE